MTVSGISCPLHGRSPRADCQCWHRSPGARTDSRRWTLGPPAAGDRFGLAAFRDRSAYIGVHSSSNGTRQIVAAFNQTTDEYGGPTIDLGSVVATAPVPDGVEDLWFRVDMDVRPNGKRTAIFFYSVDGDSWTQLGGAYELYTSFAWFLGYRFGIFNFATTALGGSIKILSFISS